jgi:hypothetical protein
MSAEAAGKAAVEMGMKKVEWSSSTIAIGAIFNVSFTAVDDV